MKKIKLEQPEDTCAKSCSGDPSRVGNPNGLLNPVRVKASRDSPTMAEVLSRGVGFKVARNDDAAARTESSIDGHLAGRASKSDRKSKSCLPSAVSTAQLKEMAGFVVKQLTPFLRGGRIASKVTTAITTTAKQWQQKKKQQQRNKDSIKNNDERKTIMKTEKR